METLVQGIEQFLDTAKKDQLSGPEIATKLFEMGISLKDAESLLRNHLNFFVTCNEESKKLSVSLIPFEGEVHPRIRSVSWKAPLDEPWASEVE